jgi:hypothetical protein
MAIWFNQGLIEHDDNARPKLEVEIAGAFDAFTSLEEIAPGADWVEVLADAWGLPVPAEHTTKDHLDLKPSKDRCAP